DATAIGKAHRQVNPCRRAEHGRLRQIPSQCPQQRISASQISAVYREDMTTTPARTRARYVEVILIVFGVYSVLLGVFMFVAPGTFFDTLGNFGARNDHYIFDNATFEFPLGLMMLAAARWSSWRVPALAFATLHWGLHALSHAIDPHHAAGVAFGWRLVRGLLAGALMTAIAL